MQEKLLSRPSHEHGQTILLVAVSLVSLLAMAALAIDVVTLYVARSETQRAADAAALAGAKAIADSGITTFLLTDPAVPTMEPWVQAAANAQINAVLQTNLVAGSTSALSSATVDWTRQGNPHITVSLNSPNLPTFFSKIWGAGPNNVVATATAEVYNPANLQPPITAIAPQSVKPWLVANVDPINVGTQFVNTSTWAVDSAVIGQSFDLVSDCAGSAAPCSLNQTPPGLPPTTTGQVQYVPALVTPNSANVCPTSVGSCNSSCLGASSYELSVECADVNVYSSLNCGGGGTPASWDNSVNPGGAAGASATGAQCLIHADGPGPGMQDTLNPGLWPAASMQITGGSCNANPAVLIANSSSIATIPIVDTATFPTLPGNVTIVGFLQAFINQVDPNPTALGQPPAGSINIRVLNIAGCSSPPNNGANPVVGGSGTSPIPVRLITSP